MIEVNILNDAPLGVDAGSQAQMQLGTPAVDTTLSVSGAAADSKTVGDKFDITMTRRGTLTASSNIHTLYRYPGFYYKNDGVAVTNGVNSSRARIVVYASGANNADYACVIEWWDTEHERLYIKTKNTSAGTYTEWREISPEKFIPNVFPLMNVPRDTGGQFAREHTQYGLGKTHEGMLDLRGAKELRITWDSTGATDSGQNNGLQIFWYGSNYAYISTSEWQHASPCVMQVPDNARYAVAYILKPIGSTTTGSLLIAADGDGVRQIKMPSDAAMGLSAFVTTDNFQAATYEVQPGVANAGRLMLPPNYDPTGNPVPVIVFVHGSNSFLHYNDEESSSYLPFWGYLANCGYAIVDCWNWTTKYEAEAESGMTQGKNMSGPYCVPTVVTAYKSAVEFYLRNYNLDEDNMYVMCKSLGGHMAEMLLATGKFRAGGLLAPALVYLGYTGRSQSFGYSSTTRAIIAEELGLEDAVSTDAASPMTVPVSDYVNNTFASENAYRFFWTYNLGRISGAMPNWLGLTGQSAAGNLEESITRVFSADDLCMTHYPPTTIWAALDDTSVDTNAIAAAVRNIQNGGQHARFRVMPDNTGGHHAVDTGTNALKNESAIVTACGVTYAVGTVPLAYVEAEEFFRKYRTR
jgi:hypothetical protein